MIIANERLLEEFRTPGKCEWCGRACRVREPHHWRAKGFGGGFRLDVRINLIGLGSTLAFECQCHRMVEDGNIERFAMLAVIAARERVLQADIEAVLWLLARLPKAATTARVEAELVRLNDSERALATRTLAEALQWG